MSRAAFTPICLTEGVPGRPGFGQTIRHTLLPGGMKSEGGRPMPLYLTRFSYTPATWAKLIKNPEDRRAAAEEYIKEVGGKLHGFWYAFGDHDGYTLWEAPVFFFKQKTAYEIGAGGALSSIQTTVLLTVE